VKQIRGLSIPSGPEDLCEPRRTALLVYDMQIGICSQIREGARIVERCAVALAAARRAGMRVVFTRHLSCPKNWMGTTQLRTAMAWQRTADPEAVQSWFLRGSPASEIVPELRPSADELVLDKLAMSAFEGTPLSYVLKDCDVLGFAIVGIALEIGIEPTVRHATDLGFVPIVLTDACGIGNAEAGARSLHTMRFVGEAIISDVESFSRLLEATEFGS
jgi:nicotinamidase-related amidase